MRISTKLILFLVAAVVAVMAVYALVAVSRTRDRMAEEMVKMADHVGMALSVGVLHHLEEGDTAGVATVLQSMMQYEDVVGAAVYGADGRLVAAAGAAHTGPEGEAAGAHVPWQLGHPPYGTTRDILDGEGRLAGRLRLVLTGHSLLEHVIEARNQILLTILVLTGVISASIVFFSRRYLAGPLAQLTAGAEAIGRGELGRRIEGRAQGEVAALAHAFNRMAGNLEATTRQIVAEREYIRGVVDSIAEGIVVVDCDRRVTAWNRTMGQRLGREVEAVTGRTVEEALPGLAPTRLPADLGAVLAGERAGAQRSPIRLPEDPGRELAVSISPLRPQGRGIEGAVLVLADITERLRLERQVQRSDKLAAVGQLAAGIAHEIGTPLNVISGTAEYLRMERGSAEELQTIVDEVRRISELVQRLMTFARQEEPRVEAVDVGPVVESVLSLMRHQMERKGVDVDVAIAADLPPLAADRGQLQQVLVNLVMNAWQAMPGGGRLTVSARREPAGEGRPGHTDAGPGGVVVEVADTGCGIAPEQLPRIFEPFYTTKDVGEGTGLGLAIVQRIVEDHAGRLEVRSEVGRGTVVELRLPTCAETAEAPRA